MIERSGSDESERLVEEGRADIKVSERPESKGRKWLLVQLALVGVGVFGVIFVLYGLISFANNNNDGLKAFSIAAWGLLLVVSAVVSYLIVTISKFRTRHISDLKKSKWRLQLVILVMGLAFGIFIWFNAFLLVIFGAKIACKPWYFYYNPDIGFCDCDSRRSLLQSNETPLFNVSRDENITIVVASLGDIALSNSGPTLELVKRKNPDLLIMNGDLTYEADPKGLVKQLNLILGPEFPVLITVGNHDTGIFTDYQEAINNRYRVYRQANEDDPLSLRCSGVIGVDQVCSFHSMGIILSGLGSTCLNDPFLNEALEDHLEHLNTSGVTWKTVFIHKNQHLLQTGDKEDEVGYFAFEKSIEHGALVVNSHEHQYARTKQLSAVGKHPSDFVLSTDVPKTSINSPNDTEVLVLKEGSSVVVLNALGGDSIRKATKAAKDRFWWQQIFSSSSIGANYGVHFCEYFIDNTENVARCFMETIDGKIADEYFLIAE